MAKWKKISVELRRQAALLLAAVRDVPFWEDEPEAARRTWWHRKADGAGCSYPSCKLTPCCCDPECEAAMDGRTSAVGASYWRAWEVFNQFREEFDEADPEVGALLADRWVPNANRSKLIRRLEAMAGAHVPTAMGSAPPAVAARDGADADGIDPSREHLFPLSELPEHWPALPGGRRLHRSVGYRYARRGVGPARVRLETVRMGATIYTSSEAVARFAARLKEAVGQPTSTGRTVTGSQRASRKRRAARILDDAGI